MKKMILIILTFFLFIGCQSSSQKTSNNKPLEPKIIISQIQNNNNKLKGIIQLSETNNFYSDIAFKNIKLLSDNCTIKSYSFNKNKISNNEKLTFEAEVVCPINTTSTLKISFDESANYIDVNLKTVTKHFVKNFEFNSTNMAIGIASIIPSSVTINEGDNFTFNIYTFDSNNSPISVPVKINPPVDNNGNIVGEFDKYSITTDNNGKGSFTYKAPKSINSNEINLSIPIIISNNITKTIHITIKKLTPIITNVKITNIIPSSVTINEGDNFTFNIYTFDSNNSPISVPVKINPPVDNNGNIVGEFDKYSITTDNNGKGSFTYKAPKSINSNEINLTISILINNNISKNIHITIKKNIPIIINPTKLIIIPNSIYISAGTKYKITILTLDDNNRGIPSEIKISHPIDQNNNSWGSFDKYTFKTNENGEGSVIFTVNKDITKLENNLSVPITISETSLTKNLLLIKPTSSTKENIIYKIKYAVADSIPIEKNFNINIQIINKKTDELLKDDNITEVNISSQNHLIYFDNNKSKFNTTLKEMNNINIISSTGKTSGIDIIDVNATINSNGTLKNISTQIPIVVISGPVRAISINPININYENSTGLFIYTYSIHAVDQYSNPVQAGTKITVGAVVNPKIVSYNGTLKPLNGSDKSEFDDSNQNFNNDLLNNTLIIFPDYNHIDPLYLGGWIIDNIDSPTKLILSSAYNGPTQNNLHYVIGNEKRYIKCSQTLAVADFDSADKTYKTNNNGIAIVKLRFDPYLIGKTISLYANSYQDKRVGTSLKQILLTNQILTKEDNEDYFSNENKHHDGIWERTANKDDNLTGSITIGVNGGANNTDLGSNTTLVKNAPITLEVLTPSICTINNNTEVNISTNCNGIVSFDVNYSDDGTCKIKFDGFNYEY